MAIMINQKGRNMLDIVVLNYNDAEQTIKFVKEILPYTSIDHIIVVDNHSTDDSFAILQRINDNERVFVIKTERNGGYGYGNNYGVRYAVAHFLTKYIAISNPDVHFEETAIIDCCNFLTCNKEYASVAPRMKNKQGNYMPCAWRIVPWYRYISHQLFLLGKKTRKIDSLSKYPGNGLYDDCDCVAGSLFVVNAELFSRVGMFDENIFLYCEETCLGIKLKKANLKTAVLNKSCFIHDHSVSISKSLRTEAKRKAASWQSRLYLMKHYYNLNSAQMLICNIVKNISIAEATVASYLRRFKSYT